MDWHHHHYKNSKICHWHDHQGHNQRRLWGALTMLHFQAIYLLVTGSNIWNDMPFTIREYSTYNKTHLENLLLPNCNHLDRYHTAWYIQYTYVSVVMRCMLIYTYVGGHHICLLCTVFVVFIFVLLFLYVQLYGIHMPTARPPEHQHICIYLFI